MRHSNGAKSRAVGSFKAPTDNGDGSKNVTLKMNSRFFKLFCVYSSSLEMSKKGEFPGVDFLGTTLKFTKRKGAFDWELKSGFRIERKIRNTDFNAEICVLEFPFFPFFFWKSEKGFEKQFQIRTVVFGFLNRTVKRISMKSGFGILNKNPPSGRISRR